MRQVSRRPGVRVIFTALLLSLAWLLPGCSPELDWRELKSAEGRFKALMPARPSQVSGVDAVGHAQTVWTAEAGHALFSIGYTDYADAALAHASEVRAALLQSSRGQLVREAALVPSQGPGSSFTIQGLAGDGSARTLQVRLLPRGTRLYRLAVVGKPEAVAAAQVDTFMDSFTADK